MDISNHYIFSSWRKYDSEKKQITLLKNKHKIIGNDIMELVLQEGNSFIKNSSTREKHYDKLNQRELITQKSLNPFLTNNSYLEDLKNQQDYLMPQNSNFELDKVI